MRRRYTAVEREQFLAELASSGDSVKIVAVRTGVGASTAYLWKKKSAPTPSPAAPRFVRLMPARQVPRSALVVQVGAASIRVEAGFDAELLRAMVSALGNGPG